MLSDDDLDALVETFVGAAVLAADAGYDFVDVKHCHGYLLHELLSGTERAGRYGGDFEHRTAFFRRVVAGIRSRAPGLAIGVRLSAYDFVPFEPGPRWRGRAGASRSAYSPFGGDGTGIGVDLTETHRFLDLCPNSASGSCAITAGSPYYNPHIQRPAFFPPSRRLHAAERPADRRRPHDRGNRRAGGRAPGPRDRRSGILVPAAVARARGPAGGRGRVARLQSASGGGCSAIRTCPRTCSPAVPLDRRLVCRTFSDCTTAPRNGMVSGCYPLDEFYKARPERVELAAVKKATRRSLR